MPSSARIIGGAGTGKTTELLRLMDLCLQKDVRDPMRIGFVSFTRAARHEASSRAGEKFGVEPETLEKMGWFRTIHSVCFRILSCNSTALLSNTTRAREWIKNAIQDDPSGMIYSESMEFSDSFEKLTDAGKALNLWHAARNRLESVQDAVRRAQTVSDDIPDVSFCEAIVGRYEEAKERDGMVDFVDLLAQVAGYRFTKGYPEKIEPLGDIPYLPVWFFDEQQDTSALLDAVCRRLVTPSHYVYVVGDPFQAIYGWAGADSRHFMNWPIHEGKQRILGKSFRCPRSHLDLSESIIRPCGDWFHRGIEHRGDEGEIDRVSYYVPLEQLISPNESWLVLGRTNFMAAKLSRELDNAGIPWVNSRSMTAEAKKATGSLCAVHELAHGGIIDGDTWKSCLEVIPSKLEDTPLLVRGTKKRFENKSVREEYSFCTIQDLPSMGATEPLMNMLFSRDFCTLFPEHAKVFSAIDRWGRKVVEKPNIKVGTIHSVKGAEADNVYLLNSIPKVCARGMLTKEGEDEERRVWYVATTRARKRMVIAEDNRSNRFDLN